MTQVVYADILLIVNTYVNYMLLRLSAVICKKKFNAVRLCIVSAVGSFYSFIILYDVPNLAIAASRVAFAVLMIISAFKIFSLREFLRLFSAFFGVNFAFGGMMYAVWSFLCPKQMYYNNTVVYFNINAITLIILTAICYAVIKGITVFSGFKTPRDTIYALSFTVNAEPFSCMAFLDTGNSLTEPFSSFPVIIVYENLMSEEGKTLSKVINIKDESVRVIPFNAVSSSGILKAVKPDCVTIKKGREEYAIKDVYIAITERKIHSGDFGALFGKKVFDGAERKEESNYVK